MIQRIQSIFLLVTAILMAVTIFSPLGYFSIQNEYQTYVLLPYGLESGGQVITHTWGIGILASLGVLLPLVNIYLFKNRKLQVKVGIITAVIILFFYLIGYSYIYFMMSSESMVFTGAQYGAVLPIIAFIFNFLAILRIRKDEKLVQSLNRIR